MDARIVTANIPTEREGKTYCTVMVNGSYDIELKDESSGAVVATLDRVCINYSEAYVPRDGARFPAKHTLDAHYAADVKASSKKCYVTFQTEFFELAHPTSMYVGLSSDVAIFDCAGPKSLKVDGHDQLPQPDGPEILKNASNTGILHIRGSFTDC